MNCKKITLLLIVLLVADQALKIWVKTHMTLDEAIMVVLWPAGQLVRRAGFMF